MPIFEYACGECGHKFEALVRSDRPAQCPKCQSTELDKLLSVFATTTASSASAAPMPNGCGACEYRDAPGGCAMH
jgi:putative FmdB family regulatory protein